jgi:hypothetical protein
VGILRGFRSVDLREPIVTYWARLCNEENILKARTNDKVKGKSPESKGKTNETMRRLTSDPTLEARDENKVGRIERKLDPAGKPLEKGHCFHRSSVIRVSEGRIVDNRFDGPKSRFRRARLEGPDK